METPSLEIYSIRNNTLPWELLRPFLEITLQDGLARQGKLSIGNTSISGFNRVTLAPLDLTPEGFQIITAKFCAVNQAEISAELVLPITQAPFGSMLAMPPPQDTREQLFVCTHPYLLGPTVPGRSTAAWEDARKLVLGARDQVPPHVPAGIVIPLWDDTAFLDQYLHDWHDWKRLAFALIRFDDGALRNNRHFLNNWQMILDSLPSDLLRVAWGTFSPHFLPLLAYLGFDAASDFSCVALADRGMMVTPYGRNRPKEGPAILQDKEAMVRLNRTTLGEVHAEIYNRIANGTLRELVELSTHLDNSIAATLRNFDAAQRESLAPQTRLNKDSPLQCTSVEAYSRPELELYRQRVRKRYSVPSYKKIVVLLPCSATKPYRESPSHRKVRETIRRAAGAHHFAVEELIVTSPLGMVPRSLEDVYPAAFYDVPVTGHWDETEVQLSTDLLADTLSRCPADIPVVALAEGGYLEICQQLTKRVSQAIEIFIPDPKLLSASVLARLSSFIEHHLHKLEGGSSKTPPSEPEEWCRAIADFQFGRGAGMVLFPSRVKVKVPRKGPASILDANSGALLATQLGSGYLRPSIDGVGRLVEGKIPEFGRISFAGEAIKGSSLFAAGVAEVDGDIHPGDIVAVLSQTSGNLLATAEAIVAGPSMGRIRAGAVAKFLDKIGRPAP